jgi:toxin ParE1/3/4
MKLVVKSPVWDDLANIADYIGRDNPGAADRFLSAVENCFALLRQNPGIGRRRSFSQPGIRSWPVGNFRNYLVFYMPRADEVQILAVLHSARDVEEKMRLRTADP